MMIQEDDCIVEVYWLEMVKLIKSYHTFWLVLFHPFSICHMSSSYMGGGSYIEAQSKPLVYFLLYRLLRYERSRVTVGLEVAMKHEATKQ